MSLRRDVTGWGSGEMCPMALGVLSKADCDQHGSAGVIARLGPVGEQEGEEDQKYSSSTLEHAWAQARASDVPSWGKIAL